MCQTGCTQRFAILSAFIQGALARATCNSQCRRRRAAGRYATTRYRRTPQGRFPPARLLHPGENADGRPRILRMPHYLLQVAYNSEAWASLLKRPHNRLEAVRAAVEKLGGKLE